MKVPDAAQLKMIAMVAVAVAGATWGTSEYLHGTFAAKEQVLVAMTKAEYVLQQQMESLLAKINALEAKRVKTADDRAQLKYWREELQRMRQVQRGK
jgi:lipoprotein NlpI